jgi:LmbE family N-acetylglucosaminyl deacetylase
VTVSLFAVLASGFALAAFTATVLPVRVGRGWRAPGVVRRCVVVACLLMVGVNAGVAAAPDVLAASPAILAGDLVVVCAGAVALRSARVVAHPTCLPRRIVAVSAHPDDLELGCGGAVAKFVDSGHEVHSVVMSGGRNGGGLTRQDEAAAGGDFLGLTSLVVLDLPDSCLPEHGAAMIRAIEDALHRYNPDLVLTHSAHDRHQDHEAVHQATVRAARGHPAILSFESPSASDEFSPQVFVDIEEYVDTKVEAVGRHDSQGSKPYMHPEHVRALAVVRGRQGRVRHAEGFEAVRVLDSRIGP